VLRPGAHHISCRSRPIAAHKENGDCASRPHVIGAEIALETLVKQIVRALSALLVFSCVVAAPGTGPAAGDSAASSFNLFSVEQDIEIGRQSAIEAEKKLSLLNDTSVDAYLNRIVEVLATEAPGARYPYHAKGVNDPAINAFALPGGPLYVNRGLLLAARNEAELSGVMAHELAHIALRHGTHQASQAYLAQTGLGILGSLFGVEKGGNTEQMVSLVGGLGLNAVFLKFSRNAESEADATGAGIMARAGYDPVAMADFFALLREEGALNPSALQTFLSDHPPPADREARIRELARSLPRARPRGIGGFESMQASVRGVPVEARADTPGR
jgi:predicted Zn-dependent protease